MEPKQSINFYLTDKKDVTNIGKLCAEAFIDFPFMKPIISDRAKRKLFLKDLFKMNAKIFTRKQLCFIGEIDGEMVVVALVRKDISAIGLTDYLRAGSLKLLQYTSVRQLINFLGVYNRSIRECKNINPSCWYLESLAVHPDYQSQHIGSQILNEHLVPYIKKNGGGDFTLITNTKRNCIFYTKNGFSLFADDLIVINQKFVENYSFIKKISS
ncbi:GNAT family N-acetyltransferase [Enterococcus faecalis]|uniref:GNAT family N-acetyltransferase n=1 Tax=Enterococcus faecalis TaxID=1351 RepID=UPI00287FA42E|nr:GNAT family N-acetyltransferase [Enterococcus faecalis]